MFLGGFSEDKNNPEKIRGVIMSHPSTDSPFVFVYFVSF